MIFNKQFSTLFLFVIIMVLFGCKSDTYSSKTKIFNSYLKNNFDKNIEINKHYYLLSNSYVCRGCLVKFLTDIDSLISQRCKNITYITTLDFEVTKKLRNKINLLKDNAGQLNIENLNLNNLTLFYTQDGRIVNISNFTLENENELIKTIKQILKNSK